MLIKRAYKTELKPNNVQRTALLKHAGAARFAYNWGLTRKREEYQKTGKSPNAIELHRQLNQLKRTKFSLDVSGFQVRTSGDSARLGPGVQKLLRGTGRIPPIPEQETRKQQFPAHRLPQSFPQLHPAAQNWSGSLKREGLPSH